MANGNFVPFAGRDLPPPVLRSNVHPGFPISGAGPPEGVAPGTPGQNYLDTTANQVYLKITGTQSLGWQLIGTFIGIGI